MQINRALLESSDITRHFMTDRERKLKKALCQLLIDKGHRKYAERFWKLDFNIIDSKKHPDFTAAISFDDASVIVLEYNKELVKEEPLTSIEKEAVLVAQRIKELVDNKIEFIKDELNDYFIDLTKKTVTENWLTE